LPSAEAWAKNQPDTILFFGRRQRLDIPADRIILRFVIFTKVFLLKLLLGFGFGLIILALL
jgi:hypothetical protein